MIFLALFYLCCFSGPWNTLALPTDLRQPDILFKTHLQSMFIRDGDKFDTRSIYNILWSCLSTIFACTVASKSIAQHVQTMMSRASDKKETISRYANLYLL